MLDQLTITLIHFAPISCIPSIESSIQFQSLTPYGSVFIDSAKDEGLGYRKENSLSLKGAMEETNRKTIIPKAANRMNRWANPFWLGINNLIQLHYVILYV